MMTKTEIFEAKRAKMSDEELIKLAYDQVHKLAETYGQSHTMSIPPRVTDTDMILSEIIKRYEKAVSHRPKWVSDEDSMLKEMEQEANDYADLLHQDEPVKRASAYSDFLYGAGCLYSKLFGEGTEG